MIMKMMNKKIIIVILLLVGIQELKAQQDVQFTHYMYNTLAVNPAYAGSKGMLNANMLGRKQWIGMDGAPSSQTLSIHTPFRNENMGVGLSVVNDKVGPIKQTSISGDYSYSIKLNEKGHKFSMGIKGTANMISASLANLKINDQSDQSFTTAQKVAPNFGTGFYYHSDNWYVGYSIPKFLQTQIESPGQVQPTKLIRHSYFLAGYVFTVNEKLKIKPATMVKFTKNSPISFDVSAEAYYMDKFSLGLMYRLKDAVGALVGYRINQQFRAGISYDFTVSKLVAYNNGTVEVFLSYDFQFKNNKVLTPRFF